MELREYQKKVVASLSNYLVALSGQKDRYEKLRAVDPELTTDLDYSKKAWEETGGTNYKAERNGLGEPLPNVYFKVPTGGGKTLLAVHAIDLVNRLYLQKQTGMVLWIVPTKQIYDQTLKSLRDRNHPYRQVLDVSSGGRTLIFEKLERFTIDDVKANLCILLLMLPSASRQSRETLKVFKDNTGYTSFFPAEDAYKEQEKLLAEFPNLQTFGEQGYMYGNLPLTSLGNVLRLLKPVTIVDEGHKAYSSTARETIYGFNPSFLLELSATPPEGVNKLVEITGKELNDEQMIKLDLHLINKNTVGWKETLSEAAAQRTTLESQAHEYEQNTNIHIRPIMLVQVERTGRDQRDGVLIHAEDVKEYLEKQLGVPTEQIAIKSSEKDDIEGIDLMDSSCPIRFIITKQALQEGWDCSFAYVLCALTKSQSETAMTQLIGRVLRQPYATKTSVKALDECYVYSFQHDTGKLVRGIKANLEGEGLGDIVGRIAVDTGEENPDYEPPRTLHYRDQFKKFAGKIYLPVFAIHAGGDWREVSYQTDLLSRIDWNKVDLSALGEVSLEAKTSDDDVLSIGYTGDRLGNAEESHREYESEIDADHIARQIVDIVPNPWVAYDLAHLATGKLLGRYDKEIVASNLIFVIEELRKLLFIQRDTLAEMVFKDLLKDGTMKFYLLQGATHCLIPSSIETRSKRRLNHADGNPIQASLFDYVPAEDVNGLEEEVALYLDKQQQLLWWYRNMSRADYRIQGWRPNRIYPDFIAANKTSSDSYDKVYVLETKGEQLVGNLDTEYKRSVLKMCSELATEKSWNELNLDEQDSDFVFAMVDESSWKSQLNSLLSQTN